jgi:hypothetical protein
MITRFGSVCYLQTSIPAERGMLRAIVRCHLLYLPYRRFIFTELRNAAGPQRGQHLPVESDFRSGNGAFPSIRLKSSEASPLSSWLSKESS